MDPVSTTALTTILGLSMAKVVKHAPGVPFEGATAPGIVGALTIASVLSRVIIAYYTGDMSHLDPVKDPTALFEAGGAVLLAVSAWWVGHKTKVVHTP